MNMAHTDIATHNGVTIRKLHSPDGSETFGWLTGVKQENGDLSQPCKFLFETEATEALTKFRVVDRINGYEVRKTFWGYTLTCDGVPISTHTSLTAARIAAGWKPSKGEPAKLTLPKSAYAQNQPGYDPHSNKAR